MEPRELTRMYTHKTPTRSLNRVEEDYIEDYSIIKTLGSGGFGKTYLGRKDGKDYAVKVLHEKRNKNYFDREVYILEQISSICSEFFSCAVEIIYNPDRYVIVSDYLEGYNSYDVFKNVDRLQIFKPYQSKPFRKEFLSFLLLQQIGSALKALHQHGIAHMDVKPDNIIYVSQEQKFKLIDFGISISLKEDYPELLKNGARGTLGFVPDYLFDNDWTDPENEILLLSTDSFALGVTVFILNEDKYPYQMKEPKKHLYDRANDIGFVNITSQLLRDSISMITNDGDIETILPYLKFEWIQPKGEPDKSENIAVVTAPINNSYKTLG